MLAQDYVQRQSKRYAERVESLRAFSQTAVEQFAQQVAALCREIKGFGINFPPAKT
jgi:hypothetical protein